MTRQVRFGAWDFYPDTHVLTRGEKTTTLEPRVARLLEYFLANPGDVLSHDQLVAFVWDDRVVSDDAIRRAVSALRHALAADGTDKLITTVPKKGYLANLPPAAAAPPPPPAPHRWLALPRPVLVLPMLLLALALGAAGWWLQGSDPPDPEPAALPHTLAVLPFIDLSESAGNAYLGDGVAEELLVLLSRFSTFWIPARSSSFQFRGQQYSPQEVGKALGVRYLVEGSVRREADQVRINVRLIDAANGFQLWAGNYNRTLSGLFALQEDIAAEVARALKVVLVEPDSRNTAAALEEAGPAGTEAYLEYLRARQLLASLATADLEAAITHLHNAIALAPEFAPAYTHLAEAMMIRANDLDAEQRRLARDTATPLIEKALELNPGLGETYAVRARLHFDDIKEQQTEADLRRSIALSPSYSEAYERLAELLFFHLQREDEALELIDQARALDPLRPRSHHIKAYMMIHLCQLDAAEELSRKALRVNPRFRSSLVILGNISSWRGELAQAVWYHEQALALDPASAWVRQMLQMSYLNIDDLAAARQVDDSSFMAVWRERLFRDDPADAGEMIYTRSEVDLQDQMSPWSETYSLLAAAMATGDFERARRHLTDRFRFSGELPEQIQQDDLSHMLNMVLIWHGESDNDHARGLIERLFDEMTVARAQSSSCLPGYEAIARALAAVALGHNADAVALLQSALSEHGIFGGWYWMLNMQPAFEPLLADPRFQVLQRSWEQTLATQQAHLNQMRRDGRIPDRRTPPRSTGTAAISQNLMLVPTNQYCPSAS